MKWVNWMLEAIKLVISYFSVENRNKDTIVEDFTNFLGDKAVNLEGVERALANLGIELGGAAVGDALDFAKTHKHTIFSMTKEEMSFIWGKVFDRDGEFNEPQYREILKSLNDEALVAAIESNADEAVKIRRRVQAKRDMVNDLSHKVSVLGRFALAKAISIASHGIL